MAPALLSCHTFRFLFASRSSRFCVTSDRLHISRKLTSLSVVMPHLTTESIVCQFYSKINLWMGANSKGIASNSPSSCVWRAENEIYINALVPARGCIIAAIPGYPWPTEGCINTAEWASQELCGAGSITWGWVTCMFRECQGYCYKHELSLFGSNWRGLN